MKICIFVEHNNGEIKNSSKELLSLASQSGQPFVTLSFGAGSKALSVGEWGSAKHFFCETLATPNPEAVLQLQQQVTDKESPNCWLASSNTLTKDTLSRLAARTNGAFTSDVTELSLSPLVARRPLYAGKSSAAVEFATDSMAFILVRPNQLPIVASTKSSSPETIELSLAPTKAQLINQEKSSSKSLDLTEANIIISGGRGLKSVEQFKLLNDMAEPLHATVGASRAVVDEWNLPHSMQVGQTGKTVAPSLYIAAGISGAIQHLAGMASSKVIVAINTDEKAPIFQKATYGIVGDILAVGPVLVEEFKKLQG